MSTWTLFVTLQQKGNPDERIGLGLEFDEQDLVPKIRAMIATKAKTIAQVLLKEAFRGHS